MNEQAQEKLAVISDMLASDNRELSKLSNYFESLKAAIPAMIVQFSEMNGHLRTAVDSIVAIVNKEQPEPEQPEPEQLVPEQPEPEQPEGPVVLPVHGIRFSDELAMCGAMGSKIQPYAPRQNDKVTSIMADINCPECLKVIAEKQAAEEKS